MNILVYMHVRLSNTQGLKKHTMKIDRSQFSIEFWNPQLTSSTE